MKGYDLGNCAAWRWICFEIFNPLAMAIETRVLLLAPSFFKTLINYRTYNPLPPWNRHVRVYKCLLKLGYSTLCSVVLLKNCSWAHAISNPKICFGIAWTLNFHIHSFFLLWVTYINFEKKNYFYQKAIKLWCFDGTTSDSLCIVYMYSTLHHMVVEGVDWLIVAY
jgi:hypothetical protein